MQIRFAHSPEEVKHFTSAQLRDHFLIQQLIRADQAEWVYTHEDRMMIGGINPVRQRMVLTNHPELRADYFLERRELGVINVGGTGSVMADGELFQLHKLDALYLGKGTREVQFSSHDPAQPAIFYLLSAPAHHPYPNRLCTKEEATPVSLGGAASSNERTIYKYIHADGVQSCQLVMGLTVLAPGSVWNSVPPHTHTRRMEVYFYFDVPADQRIFHFMGQPQETRHIVMANHEAVISAPWSVHFGCGTANYGFIWGMAGENKEFTDMDPSPVPDLR